MERIKKSHCGLNSRGLSIVELVVSAGILSIVASGLGYSLFELSKSRNRSEHASQAVALEASFLSAMADPGNYSQQVLEAMQAGQNVTGVTLNMRVPVKTSNGVTEQQVAVIAGRPSFFRADLSPCPAASLTHPSCAFSLQLDLRRIAVQGSLDPVRYAFAYKIDFNESIGFASLGSVEGNTFDLNEYTVTLPNNIYRRDGTTECNGDTMLVRGFDPETGEVICLQRSTTPCPANTLPLGLEVSGGQIRVRCSRPTDIVSCPANYSLSMVNLDSLVLPNRTPTYSCVYSGRDIQAYPRDGGATVFSGGSLNGVVCPPRYYLSPRSRCQVVETRNRAGTCYRPSMTVSAPARNGAGQWYVNEVQTFASYTVPARPGRLIERYEGGALNCAVEIPQQDCGAEWDGVVQLQVECLLYRGDGEPVTPTVTTFPPPSLPPTTTTTPPVASTTTTLPGTTTTTTSTTTTLITTSSTTTSSTTSSTTTTTPPGGGLSGGGCFVAGSQVSMADGTFKNIEDMRPGDRILAWDEYANRPYKTHVVEFIPHAPMEQTIFSFELADGTILKSNHHHPIWVAEYGSYMRTDKILASWLTRVPVSLLKADGSAQQIVDIKITTEFVPVYNLSVRGITTYNETTGFRGYGHNYFVNGVLVHNQTAGGGDLEKK